MTLLGQELTQLSLAQAQQYIRGHVWKHFNTHGYANGHDRSKAYWLSAHLCAKAYSVLHYIDDEPRKEPAPSIRRDDKDWGSEIGYSAGHIGIEIRRLVAADFLREDPLQGNRPKHYVLGPQFPTHVENETLFDAGTYALKVFEEKTATKLKRKKAKEPPKPRPKSTLPEDRLSELTDNFNNEIFEALKKDHSLFSVVGGWVEIVDNLKKLKNIQVEALNQILHQAQEQLLASVKDITCNQLAASVYAFMAELHHINYKLRQKQAITQFAKNYKEAKCLQ